MANDRVFIRCDYCGGWKMLLKYSLQTGSTHRDNSVLEWLSDHSGCHPNKGDVDLSGDQGFSLVTESSDFDLYSELQNYNPKENKNG